jgi:hypothetical protein
MSGPTGSACLSKAQWISMLRGTVVSTPQALSSRAACSLRFLRTRDNRLEPQALRHVGTNCGPGPLLVWGLDE